MKCPSCEYSSHVCKTGVLACVKHCECKNRITPKGLERTFKYWQGHRNLSIAEFIQNYGNQVRYETLNECIKVCMEVSKWGAGVLNQEIVTDEWLSEECAKRISKLSQEAT